jgi:hypothetical protein
MNRSMPVAFSVWTLRIYGNLVVCVSGVSNGDVSMSNNSIREQIMAALSHPEAEDGLYFNNLIVVHEEEERPIVEGDETIILQVLDDMVFDGTLSVSGEGSQKIYMLVQQ